MRDDGRQAADNRPWTTDDLPAMLRIALQAGGRHVSCVLPGLLMLPCLAIIGCTGPRVNAVKPVEHVLYVQADGLWQDSGAYAKRGQLIQCAAEGKWGDRDRTYDPEGNKDCYKNHLGVDAPAFALLMKVSTETNKAYMVGTLTNIVAARSGYVLFRNNVSLPALASGQLRVSVKVVSDADQDGVSDYDEVHVWGLDPLSPDSDGDGFSDLEEVFEKKGRAIDTGVDENEDRK